MKRVKLSERQRLCERHTVRTLKRIMSYRSGLLLLLLLSLFPYIIIIVIAWGLSNYVRRVYFIALKTRFFCAFPTPYIVLVILA